MLLVPFCTTIIVDKPCPVMPALVAGIHDLRIARKDVDDRNKSGHDECDEVR